MMMKSAPENLLSPSPRLARGGFFRVVIDPHGRTGQKGRAGRLNPSEDPEARNGGRSGNNPPPLLRASMGIFGGQGGTERCGMDC